MSEVLALQRKPFLCSEAQGLYSGAGSWESCGLDLQRNGEIKAETEVRDRVGAKVGWGVGVKGVCPC